MSKNKSSKRKKVIRIWKNIILAGIIVFTGLYLYTKFYWTKILSPGELDDLIVEIKKAEPLPEKLYTLYELHNPNSLTTKVNYQMFRGIFTMNFTVPQSVIASRHILHRSYLNKIGNWNKISQISLSWKLEAKTTQKECLNWVMANSNFLFNNRGVIEASNFYFDKELFDLNDVELAKLVLMFQNARFFNARKEISKKRVDAAVKVLLQKLEEKNSE